MQFTKAAGKEYGRLFASCSVRPQRRVAVDGIVDRIVASKARYTKAGKAAGVPWYVVGVIHLLESGGDFSRHLHNGDPLTARTVRVPSGRPASGSPPFTLEASAADALKLQRLDRWQDWSVPGALYVLERYNGFGYRGRGINSPYLWSFSNHYAKGKYVADGRYSPTAVSEQCGAAVALLRMAERGLVDLGTAPWNGPVPRRTDTTVGEDVILVRGAKGKGVTALKKRLAAWFEAAAPGEWARFRVAGNDVFGTQLERAVKAFQARNGLLDDGEVGPLTRAALRKKPRPVRKLAVVTRASVPYLDFPGKLRKNAVGPKVALVQGWLTLHGNQVVVDDEFGSATQRALRDFQAKRGLDPTGVLDQATWDALTAPMVAALQPITRRAPLGELVVAYAKQHLRQHAREIPPNSGPWVRLYTGGKEGKSWPWCAAFATYMLKQAAETLAVGMAIPCTAACDVMAAKAGPRFLSAPGPAARAKIRPGSFFVQRATGSERRLYKYRHTGIVVEAHGDFMRTIEGNTNDEGSAEGYEVCARTRGYTNMDFVLM